MIRKSSVDKAEYEYHVLPNGMKALTISDPTLDLCSCAVSVKIGSFDDPAETAGLSHFLEHMLFMGTEKYPKEDTFFSFLSQSNGSSNAATAAEVTVYFFDAMPEAFKKALDMFVDFFRGPLFLKDSVDREISAVNSEFINGLNMDTWRTFRMLGLCCKQEEAGSKFVVGNNRSLRKDGIWEEVREFWKKKYSSDIMCVVIYGNESSSELKRHLGMFDGIPRLKDADDGAKEVQPRALWKEGHTIFDERYLNRWIKISPIADKKTLMVSVTVPSEYDLFRNNPYLYISNVFQSKDKDGFIYHLKDRGLAFSCEFDVSNNTGYSVVSMTVSLSKKGTESPQLVLECLVSYLRNMKVDEKEYLVLKDVYECLFKYKERSEPSDTTCDLAEKMQFYPVGNILDSEYVFDEFQGEQIKDLVMKICDFEKWLVFYMTKDFEADLEEEIYGIKYSVGEKIFEEVQQAFSGTISRDLTQGNDKDWISVENTSFIGRGENDVAHGTFKKKMSDSGKITYLFDDSYAVPKACVGYVFRIEDITERLVELMFLIWNAEDGFCKRYDSLMYKTQVSITSHVSYYGVEVRFDGFSREIPRVAKLFFDFLFDVVDTSRCEIIKEEINDELQSEKNVSPYRLLVDGLMSLRIPGHLSPSQKIEKLCNASLETRMPNKFFVEVFAVGDIKYEEVVDMFENICTKQTGTIAYKEVDMLQGLHRFDVNTADTRNNACGLYYYSGECGSYRCTAMAHFITQACKEMFFDQLRTKEELGYVVSAGIRCLDKFQYISFVVQSEKDVDFLETRIKMFVKGLGRHFEQMTSEDFSSFKKSVVACFQEKHKNFSSYSLHLWNRYLKGIVDIDYEKNVIRAVEDITKEDVLGCNILCNPLVVKAFAH